MLTRQAWPAACVGVDAAVLPGGIVMSDPPRMHETASCGTCEHACAYISLHPYYTLTHEGGTAAEVLSCSGERSMRMSALGSRARPPGAAAG